MSNPFDFPAPWTIPQMSAITVWIERYPLRAPRCPKHGVTRPKLNIRFDGCVCPITGCGFRQVKAAEAPTVAELRADVDRWNAGCPEGTYVQYEPDDAEQNVYIRATRSRAIVHPTIGPAVYLKGTCGAIPLERVKPMPQTKRNNRRRAEEHRSVS